MKSINKKDTIFVAGHTGMVGSALVRELLKKDIITLLTNSKRTQFTKSRISKRMVQ